MSDPRSSPPSGEPAPSSGSPTVTSTPPVAGSTPPASKLPYWITAMGLLGVVGFVLVRLTLPAGDAAAECLHAAVADDEYGAEELGLDVEIVSAGKLEVGGRRATDIANGPLADPIRRKAIERCRAQYARQTGVGAGLPLLQVEAGVVRVGVERRLERAGTPDERQPVAGALVSVESHPEQGSCVSASSGQCELALRHLAHDAKLGIVAKLPNGAVVSRSSTVVELLQNGLVLEALERTPAITISVVSCNDRQPLAGVMLQASAVGSHLWSTECGPTPPAETEKCSEMMGRHGDASFHYDIRPEVVTITVIPPGEAPRETLDVTLGALNTIQLSYGSCPTEQPAPTVDCPSSRRILDSQAQLTRVPAAAQGHQLDVLVEVMSSGMVS
ncbi:MAG TPA: hypothetical protein VMG12_26920, partial [Polyangiaceae bacterium]|nr:hypothetical protein [Polyangiaceae bacterium]